MWGNAGESEGLRPLHSSQEARLRLGTVCMRKDLPVGRTHTRTRNSVIFPWQSVLRSLNLREETALVLTSRKVTETPKESQPCSVRETMNGETRYAHVPV